MDKLKEHWDHVYSSKEITQLGWYEDDPNPSFKLIEELDLDKSSKIIDVGCGATKLLDKLVSSSYSNLIGVDISSNALDILGNRLGNKVKLIEDDIREPKVVDEISGVKLWHDRAVLHFINDESSKETYVNTLNKVLEVDGYAIIAAFSLDGAEKCSGLPVHRYSSELLETLLGENYKLIKSLDYLYHNPSGGKRPYVYTVFQRVA